MLTLHSSAGCPCLHKTDCKGDPNDLPIHITAEDVRGEYPNFVEYEGNVDIQQREPNINR